MHFLCSFSPDKSGLTYQIQTPPHLYKKEVYHVMKHLHIKSEMLAFRQLNAFTCFYAFVIDGNVLL